MMPLIAFYLILAAFVSAVFFAARNVWLFNQLLRLSDDEVLSIKLGYNQMVLRFWIWDVRKFTTTSPGVIPGGVRR